MDFYGYGVETGQILKKKSYGFWHIPCFSDREDPGERVSWMKAKVMEHRFSINPYECSWILRARSMAFDLGSFARVIFVASFEKVRGNIATRFGFEEEAIVMVKMNGMVLYFAVMIFIAGQDRKSGIILFFPLICEISKEYWENHVVSLSN